jgi:hypothetical protein
MHPPLILSRHAVWGDEMCNICGKQAWATWCLVWPDGVDEDYEYACIEHTALVTAQLWTRYAERRHRAGRARD